MKYITIFLTILISFYFYSCADNKNELNLINPSISVIEIEGEGGEVDVLFTNPNWKVAGIINRSGNVGISGDSYSLDGSLIRENHALRLDSLGRMDAIWTNKGFSITRNSYTSLNILVEENGTGKNFDFAIIIETDDESKEIQVRQKKSHGYAFKDIEYRLDKNDGDSIFLKQGPSFSFDIPSAQNFSFFPINGTDMLRTSFFKSCEKDAFVWTETDSLLVRIPSDILNDKLYFDGKKSIYTNVSIRNESEHSKQMRTVPLPSGKSNFFVQVEYRKRTVSYALYLVNSRTKKEKVIKGKWVEYAPTGICRIVWNK